MIPRKLFDSDLEGFRDTVRKFLENEAVPFHAQWEKDGQVSRELWLKGGEMGFLCPTAPEAYGGLGCDFRYSAVVMEEISRTGCSGIGWPLHSDIVMPYIQNWGSEEQKQKYIPKLISGEMISAIAMTEPGAGSDLQGVKSTAVKQGDHYLLNGSKTFITNGQMADLVIVVAKTDPSKGAAGISLFLVESQWEGFEKGSNLDKIGMKAQDTSELFFNDVKVPVENLLGGKEGTGFMALMQELPQERLLVALTAVAACEAALEWTKDYIKERKAFGKPICKFQNTRFKMAELITETNALRAYTDFCLELHLDKKLDIPTAAGLKQITTDLQFKVMDECVQLHGGYGYMTEYPIARAWADSRVQKIYAGTNEIMKEIVARAELG
ncbi:acyl-CoA dehydrogenase family protein [Bermanella sp. R86510]|uniref:acyl-CoA dehydrogenase family protein n=1 Tax=unclassified Bermanella TaxID=2627862 RepID=UPI0037CC707F